MSDRSYTVREEEQGSLLKAGLLALVLAFAANLIAYGLLALLVELPAGFAPLQPAPIAIFTALGAVGATITFAIVRRVSGQPARTFTIVAVVAFVLSIIPNILLALDPTAAPIPGADAEGFLILILFHVVAAVVIVLALLRSVAPGPR